MAYVGTEKMYNLIADKEEEETYELGTFCLNGGGKNDCRISNGKATLLSDFKDNKIIHIKGNYITPSGVYQEVQIASNPKDVFSGNGKGFSNLTDEEKKEAIKQGVRENFYTPNNALVHCSEEKFED